MYALSSIVVVSILRGLCERVSELLIRRGADQPETLDLLRNGVLANSQSPPNTRQRAAYVVYANAPESEIAVLASQATVEADRDVQLAALRGLARHKSPAARIALEGVARTYPGDRGIQAILREMNAPPPVAEEDE